MPIAPYPKRVTRDQTNAACWALGVDPATVREMHFTPREVTIRAAVLSEPYVGSGSASATLIHDGLYAAETTVVIPVELPDAQPQDYVIRLDAKAGYAKVTREVIEDRQLCESTPRYMPGGWTGPVDEKPEGMMQA